MRLSHGIVAVAAFLVSGLLVGPVRADSITINSAVGETVDKVGTTIFSDLSNSPDVHFASIGVQIKNITDFHQTTAGFSMTMNHERDGNYLSTEKSSEVINFTANAAVNYTASGNYTFTSSVAEIFSQLKDLTDNSNVYVFYSKTDDPNLPGVTFTLGGNNGQSNVAIPVTTALNGILKAGHVYELRSRTQITDLNQRANNGATANGSMSLTFDNGAPAAAPLPSTALLGLVLLGGLGLVVGIRQKHLAVI